MLWVNRKDVYINNHIACEAQKKKVWKKNSDESLLRNRAAEASNNLRISFDKKTICNESIFLTWLSFMILS